MKILSTILLVILSICQVFSQLKLYTQTDDDGYTTSLYHEISYQKVIALEDNRTMLLSDLNTHVYMYDAESKMLKGQVTLGGGIYDFSDIYDFTYCNSLIILAGIDTLGNGIIKIFNKQLALQKEYQLQKKIFTSVSGNGNILAAGTDNNQIWVIDLNTFEVLDKIRTQSQQIWTLETLSKDAILADGSNNILELVGLHKNTQEIYRYADMNFYQLRSYNDKFYALNGTKILTFDPTGKLLDSLKLTDTEISAFTIDSCNNRLYFADIDETISARNPDQMNDVLDEWQSKQSMRHRYETSTISLQSTIEKHYLDASIPVISSTIKNNEIMQIELDDDFIVTGQYDGSIVIRDTALNLITKAGYPVSPITKLDYNSTSGFIAVQQQNGYLTIYMSNDLKSHTLNTGSSVYDDLDLLIDGRYYLKAYNTIDGNKKGSNIILEKVLVTENEIGYTLVKKCNDEISEIQALNKSSMYALFKNGVCAQFSMEGTPMDTLPFKCKDIESLKGDIIYFLSDKNEIYTGTYNKKINRTTYQKTTDFNMLTNFKGAVSISVSSDNKFIAIMDSSREIFVYDIEKNHFARSINMNNKPSIADFEVSNLGEVYIVYKSEETTLYMTEFDRIPSVIDLHISCDGKSAYILKRGAGLGKYTLIDD